MDEIKKAISDWRDTVMSDERVDYEIKYAVKHNPGVPLEVLVKPIVQSAVQTQAKITYPIAYKAGLKEVIEWLKEYHRDEGGLELHLSWQGIIICEEVWQAKLKDWGIE